MEPRLVPVNAVMDLCMRDGLNPSPLADAGWAVVGLEVPVRTPVGTAVCDLVLFDSASGSLAAVEAKSGANVAENQARRLAAVTPQMLIDAGGITIPQAVPLSCEVVFACVAERTPRIVQGVRTAGVTAAVLSVGPVTAVTTVGNGASKVALAIPSPVEMALPPARIIPFDQDSPDEVIDQVVEAELTALMSRLSPVITVRALTEQVAPFYGIYGMAAQGRMRRRVADSARRAAAREPNRLRVEPSTAVRREERVVILGSPEQFDRRGRTQGYQSLFGARPSGRRPRAQVPGQMDLLDELDQAETAAKPTGSEGDDDIGDVAGQPGDDGPGGSSSSPLDDSDDGSPLVPEEGAR